MTYLLKYLPVVLPLFIILYFYFLTKFIPFIQRLINKRRSTVLKKFVNFNEFEDFLKEKIGDKRSEDFMRDLEYIKCKFDDFSINELKLIDTALKSYEHDFSKNFSISFILSFVILVFIGKGTIINIYTFMIASLLSIYIITSYHKNNFKIKQVSEIVNLCIYEKKEIEKKLIQKQ